MDRIVNDAGLDILFRTAARPGGWLDRPVSDTLLRALWELVRLAPHQFGCAPARVCFVKSIKTKSRLLAATGLDQAGTGHPPVVAVIGGVPQAGSRRATEWRDGALQASYLMLAARALGLDAALIGEVERGAIDRDLFPDQTIGAALLCALGYGDHTTPPPQRPGLAFDEACRIV